MQLTIRELNRKYRLRSWVMLLRAKVIFHMILLSMFFVGTNTAFHGSDLICMKCHTMHASEDGQLPIMPGDSGPAEGPNPHLLYKASSTDLCLVCHDGQDGIPDVIDDDVNDPDPSPVTERAAGRFAGGSGVDNPNGHDLGVPVGSDSDLCLTCHFEGSFSTAEIGCVNCHDPHGKSIDYDYPAGGYSYRNLLWAEHPENTPQIKAYVDLDQNSHPNDPELRHYIKDNVAYPAPSQAEAASSDWREVSNICIDCHHTFSGDTEDFYYAKNENGDCIRHPNTDTERNAWAPVSSGATDPSHWVAGTGYGFSIDRVLFLVPGAADYTEAREVLEAPTGGRTNGVMCLTCHKAHGTENANSVRWGYTSGGQSLGCQQCHNKGS